jgi:hypothetical protein
MMILQLEAHELLIEEIKAVSSLRTELASQ